MIKAFTIGKILILGTFSMVVFIAWKSVSLDNLQAKQIQHEERMAVYETRFNGYDRELENVRVDSRVNLKLLEQVREDTKQIKQILLNKR